MMRHFVVCVLLAGLVASSANAALLYLAADDGSGHLDLAPGESGNMNIVLTIRDIDPSFWGVTVFLDDEDNQGNGTLDVVDLIQGLESDGPTEVFYERSTFELPADISHDGQNEYALIMGLVEGNPWGPGTYTLDTLVITNGSDEAGVHPITFEKGDRAPQIYCCFVPYHWGFGFDNIVPGFADPGVGGADNPFMINTIPEPTTLAVVVLGGLALLRRRADSSFRFGCPDSRPGSQRHRCK